MIDIGWKISKNKAWELQLDRFEEWCWFRFALDLTRNCDHAGFRLFIEVFGFFAELSIYDVRHWSYETKSWEN